MEWGVLCDLKCDLCSDPSSNYTAVRFWDFIVDGCDEIGPKTDVKTPGNESQISAVVLQVHSSGEDRQLFFCQLFVLTNFFPGVQNSFSDQKF